MSKLNGGTGLAMIHSSEVDFAGGRPFILTRKLVTEAPAGPDILEVETITVSRTSELYSMSGQVRRVGFRDEVSGEHDEVDVMLCRASSCSRCSNTSDSLAKKVTAPRGEVQPIVCEEGIVYRGGGNWEYIPKPSQARPHEPPIVSDRVLLVVFNGGRKLNSRILASDVDPTSELFDSAPLFD